jgi:hypothetical protein
MIKGKITFLSYSAKFDLSAAILSGIYRPNLLEKESQQHLATGIA